MYIANVRNHPSVLDGIYYAQSKKPFETRSLDWSPSDQRPFLKGFGDSLPVTNSGTGFFRSEKNPKLEISEFGLIIGIMIAYGFRYIGIAKHINRNPKVSNTTISSKFWISVEFSKEKHGRWKQHFEYFSEIEHMHLHVLYDRYFTIDSLTDLRNFLYSKFKTPDNEKQLADAIHHTNWDRNTSDRIPFRTMNGKIRYLHWKDTSENLVLLNEDNVVIAENADAIIRAHLE